MPATVPMELEKTDGAGSVVDESYLLLVSDQALRSTVLFGRIDLGCPSYLGPYPGQPDRPCIDSG